MSPPRNRHKASREKGKRREREIVRKLRDRGFNAYRVPLSGATEHFKHDVVIEGPLGSVAIEVKARRTLPKAFTPEPGVPRILIADRSPPVAVIEWEHFVALMTILTGTKPGGET